MIAQAGQRLLGYGFDRLYVAGRRYAVYDQTPYLERHTTPDQRATGFDWALYQVMVSDRGRVEAYRQDIASLVTGKTVLEIGPGPLAVLTVLAAEAGATSVVSIEANAWAATEARRRVRRYEDRVRIVTGHTDELDLDAAGVPRHVDVLLIECYHSIASQEQVVETVAALRRRGLSFDVVISKGFTTFVAPAAAPTSGPMSVLERLVLGWPARRSAADAAMTERTSSLHGDMVDIASRRLAPAERWQWCDFEGDGSLGSAETLRFPVGRVEQVAGLQFFNHFHFHHGTLDTGASATHWGAYFVPVPLGLAGWTGPGELVLTTHRPVPDQPSITDLEVELAGVRSATVRL